MSLPKPNSTSEQYQLAQLLLLERLVTAVEKLAPIAEETAVLIESSGELLPANFPGKLALEAAGIIYLESVPRDGDALTAITGIGKVTAGQILAELA